MHGALGHMGSFTLDPMRSARAERTKPSEYIPARLLRLAAVLVLLLLVLALFVLVALALLGLFAPELLNVLLHGDGID